MGDSMSSIVVSGDTSGAITLAAPAVAGTNTLTLPANTGTILTTASTFAGTGPAFSAYVNSSSLSVTANTDIKIPFDAEVFDTANCFNTSTSRFTPNVAGYYQFSIGFQPEGSTALTRAILILNKNGGNDAVLQDFSLSTIQKTSGSKLVYMNGTTDYVEGHCYIFASSAILSGGSSGNWFTGAMVRAA